MNPAGYRRILCLEHVALLRSRIVREYLAHVDALAIFEPYGAWAEGQYHPDQAAKELHRWRRSVGAMPVHRLTHYEYFDEMIAAGEEAIQFLETDGASILKGSAISERLHRLLRSEIVGLALRKGLATYLKDRIHFCKIVTALAEQPGVQVLVAPAYHDGFPILTRWFGKMADRVQIPPDLERLSCRQDRFRQVVNLLYAIMGLPIRFNQRSLKSFTPLRVGSLTPRNIDWARTIAYGFDDRKVRSDACLEGTGDFSPSRFLYVYDWWRFDKTILSWRRKLEERGAQFVDVWRLRMPVWFYLQCKLPASWQRILWCWEGLREGGQSKLCQVGYTILDAYVDAELFMQYYRPKVFNVRDDYLPGHIVRTIVFNRYGCKTIGFQHGSYASLGLNPYIAYTYCNTYCAYGPVYFERIWRRAWSYNERRALVGVERNDYVYQASRDAERLRQFKVQYPGKKVLLWYPPAISVPLLTKLEKVEEVFRRLATFSKTHPDWVVILHARPEEQAQYPAMQETLGAGACMAVEERFSTYELLVYVDAILAPNLSTLGIEAICAGRDRVAFVNYWGEWKHPFRRYSESLVVSDNRQLEALLESWVRGEGSQDPSALAAFRRDFDIGFDGQAYARYKNEMRLLAGLNATSTTLG